MNKEQETTIVDDYKTGEYSMSNLGRKHGVSRYIIDKILTKNNIEKRKIEDIRRKYPVDETYFDSIDTWEKAYFLGLLYTDGSNSLKKNTVTLALQEKDKHILEDLNALLQPTKPILCKGEAKKESHQRQFALSICNYQISRNLEKWGVVPNKTFLLTWPDWMNEELYPAFILGLWDGDGSISSTLTFTGTEDMCLKLQKIIREKLNVFSTITHPNPERNNNIRRLVISRHLDKVVFLNWIYENAILFIKRKYERYQNLLQKDIKPRNLDIYEIGKESFSRKDKSRKPLL